MFLKRLELQGFKSFADKTVLEFGGGVTAVVGPNGSGKSNISDAIRWVMGEMSAKSLRGSNMQDVIFAGTEKRKPLNYAEVSLVLDNSDRVFNVDYNEVIVTRRVFRSGETAYQINRVNCRLKDIHELFMDTGLGRDGYSIIGQGSVAQILSTKAEDRRNLFEEAAGVSKYKYKKEESERKLVQVEENLVRIGDIAAELEGQLGPLKNQSEKARKYLLLYDEYKTLDINISMLSLKRNEATEEKVNADAASVNGEIEDIRSKESDTEQKISSLYEQSRQKDDEQAEKNEKLVENHSKIMELKNEASLSGNTVQSNLLMIQRLENEINDEALKSANMKQAAAEGEIRLEEKHAEMISLCEKLSDSQAHEREIGEKISDNDKEISLLRFEATDILSSISSEKAKAAGIEQLRESFISRRNSISEELESFKRNIESTKIKLEQLDEKKSALTEKHEKLTALIKKQNDSMFEKRRLLQGLNDEQNSAQIEYRSKASKRRILEDMENEYEGYAKSVKTILRSDEMKKLSIYGTVAGLVEASAKYAVAVETALGAASQNLIVETEEDAKAAIAFLRKTNSGRATFLPVSSVNGRTLDNIGEVSKAPGFIGIGCELIKYNPKYDGIMKQLLGRVVVVDNIDNGIALSRKFSYKFRVVTLEGDIMNAGGSMTGGSTGKTGGFLSRAAEIKTLRSQLAEIERTMKIRSEHVSRETSQLDGMKERLDSYLQMQREYENELLKNEETLRHLSEAIGGSGGTEEGFENELKTIEEKLSETGEQIAVTLSGIRSLELEKKNTDEKCAALEEEHRKLLSEKENISAENMNITLELTNVRRDIEELSRQIKSFKEGMEQALEQTEKKKKDIEDIKKSNEALILSEEQKLKDAEELETAGEEIKARIEQITVEKSAIVARLKEIQSSNKELTDRLITLQQELSRINSKQVKLTMEKENIINRLWEEYELTYSDAEERFKEPENEKEESKRLSELKGQIKALGSINMDSIEEYKNVSERYDFLSAQKKDLDDSKENLEKIIISMEELMKEHFSEQFSAINESFGFVFRELFGGGRGRLYLQDPENILESGIEIEVQLPGKGLQNINLYSGGEKSFIAIALLFAILRVKPTPFCILDEIDAALDDVNVARFATYLKNYLDQSQFIVITHRRGTMEAANIMYGVTMQEKGVSKLLSLHMDDVDETMAD
ncbi:MAG: chromosome segregation protein SMC [Clostridia bacterium]|nr:chromosome segregation protein SMC [Clostridia bacterium]